MNGKVMLVLGHGYSAAALSKRLIAKGWRVIGTTRSPERMTSLSDLGVEARLWPGTDLGQDIDAATHVLVSTAPEENGDPVLTALKGALAGAAAHISWLGYLSTTAVYGDHAGGWVTEDTPLTPATRRGHWRVAAETAWREFSDESGLPLHIFRLAGIYGPGRGPFAKVRSGTARRIVKPGQVFSRIHVEDIAQVLEASIDHPNRGAAYNVCDMEAAPPEDVIGLAAEMLGLPLPPAEDFATAQMTPMARSFYAESKRVRNDRILEELGVKLAYPTYREGLAALLASESGA